MVKNTFKFIVMPLIIASSCSAAVAGRIETTDVAFGVDPRVELVSIIFRLSGNEEYNVPMISSYDHDVDNHFKSFIDHPAVKFAGELARTKGIGFDGPIWMAIHLKNSFSPRKDINFPQSLIASDSRWSTEDAKKFAALAEKFAKDTAFDAFFVQHRILYTTAESRMQEMFKTDVRLSWFQRFFGKQPGTTFHAIPGMLTGGQSYGPSVKTTDGHRDIYAVITIYSDNQDLPNFSEEARHIAAHEFIHAYTNPVTDKFASKLESSGKKLFGRTSELMKRQNYGDWRALIYESINRACGIRYTFATKGPEAAYQLSKQESDRGFYWVPGLADLMVEYEKQPRAYNDLAQFFPKIINYFNEYSTNAPAEPGR